MRAPSGISSPADAGRVAAAGELLVVVQDDLGDRAVALDALDELRALLRMELDQLPLVVGQLAVREQDRVGQDELADVVQQRGGVDQVLLALVEAQHPGDLARVAGDGGRVARGHRVAHRQRLQHRRQQAHLQRRELARALGELLAALLGLDARAQDVEEDEQHTAARPTDADAEMAVRERHAGRQQRRRELGRQRGDERAAASTAHRDAVAVPACGRRPSAKLSAFVSHEDAEDDGGEPQRVAVPRRRSRRRAMHREPADAAANDGERRRSSISTRSIDGRDIDARRRSVQAIARATAGAGPSSAIASTIARNEPDRRRLADLEAEHLAARGQHEQQPDQRQRRPVLGAARQHGAESRRDAGSRRRRRHDDRASSRHYPGIRHAAVAI